VIKAALIGCGRIADRHARVMHSLEDVRLAAVADLNERKARAFGERFGAVPYTDFRRMIEREKPDLVHVLTQSGRHAAITLAALDNVSNVIVEKPMALTLADADAMIEKSERLGRRLFIVKQNRYNLPVRKLREEIDAERFGRLVLGAIRVRWCRRQDYYDQDPYRGTWAEDGGVLTNQASHHIDLLRWIFGPPLEVSAMTARQLVRIEAEDTGVSVVRFRNGALGTIEATTATRPTDLEASISVLGEHGTVEIGGFALNEMRVWKFDDENADAADVLATYRTNPPDVYGFGHHEFLREAVEAIRADRPPAIDGREGRKSLELIVAIYESAESGQRVTLPFTPEMCRLGRPGGSPPPEA
jgi:UDP-N-acetyl-2-amino-2-deoxyglucuronate dehydrogenase